MRKLLGKKTVIFMVFMCLALVVSACGGNNNNTGNNAGNNTGSNNAADSGANQGSAGKTIELLTFFNPDSDSPRERAFKTVIDQFTADTGIEVKFNTVPWNEVNRQLILAVNAGNAPDVSFVEGQQFALHMSEDSLMPLNSYIDRDMTEADKSDHLNWDFGVHTDDQKYIFPISYLATGLFVRADLLEEAGLDAPTTWDEVIEVGKALQTDNISGFLYPGSPKQPSQMNSIQPMVESRGGLVLDEAGKAVFNSQAGVETFRYLNSLVHEHGITPNDAGSLAYDEVTDIFASGRAAMIIEGSHRYLSIAETLGKENIKVVPIPGVDSSKSAPTTIIGWTLGIPKNSKQPDEAWELIKYFNTTEAGLKYAEISGEIPVLKSVSENEIFNDPEKEVTNFFVNYINENGISMVQTPYSAQLYEIVAETIQQSMINASPDFQKILDDAVAQFNKISGN